VTLFGTYISFQFLVTHVTAVVDAGGAAQLASAQATLAAYRPALGLITGIAAIGMPVAVSGLRNRPDGLRSRPDQPVAEASPRSGLAVGRDDDHQGRPALAGAVRVAAASGPRRSGGRQDRPGPADVPAG
jgi:hypothetical protein